MVLHEVRDVIADLAVPHIGLQTTHDESVLGASQILRNHGAHLLVGDSDRQGNEELEDMILLADTNPDIHVRVVAINLETEGFFLPIDVHGFHVFLEVIAHGLEGPSEVGAGCGFKRGIGVGHG
jgi:hypothetical protein